MKIFSAYIHSNETHLLLNPRLPQQDLKVLRELSEKFPLKNHFWLTSSGSSADKKSSIKLVALSQSAILASAQAVNKHLQANVEDRWAQCLPQFHVGGLGVEARAFLTGSKVFSGLAPDHDCESFKKWDPRYCYQILKEQKISLTALVPAQIFDLVQLKLAAPTALRAVIIGGTSLSQDLYEQAIFLGWPLMPSFGMSECSSQIATAELESWTQKKRNLKILSHIQMRRSSEGFLEVRAPSLFTGYAQVKNGNGQWWDPKQDGWFVTEDQGELHQEFLVPLGRKTDFVKVLGEGVNLLTLQEKLDGLLFSSEFFGEVVIIAIPEARRENQICLIASSKVPMDFLEEITLIFNRQVVPYEKIQTQKVVAEIPRTALGKLARQELLGLLANL